jgi:hypothetical protein
MQMKMMMDTTKMNAILNVLAAVANTILAGNP